MNETHQVALLNALAAKPQGPFIDAFVKFISSPAGQAILAALIAKLFPAGVGAEA